MGKIFEQTINRFDGGMVNDPREPWSGQQRVSKHFDILTDPHRMVPRLAMATEGTGDTEKLVQILSTSSTLTHYALGVSSGTTQPKIFERLPPGGSWSASTNGTGSNTGRNEDVFIEYKDALYGATGGTRIWAYVPSTTTFTDTALSLAATATNMTCPPVIHSLDDKLYAAYDNYIVSKNGGVVTANWTDPALTLPTNLVITSMCEFGIYLAIACRSKYSNGKSVVFFWNRESTVSTLTARVDWGSGDIRWIQELNGTLIGASRLSSTGTISSRIVFKYCAGVGSGAVTFKEILTPAGQVHLDQHTIKTNRRIYFPAAFTLAPNAYTGAVAITSTVIEGIFSLGVNSQGGYVLTHEYVLNNNTDTTLTNALSSDVMHGLFLQGDVMSVMYTDNSSYVALRSDVGGATLTTNSTYESLIFDGRDPTHTKKLLGTSVTHEPLPSGASVQLDYRKDAETSWTTILTSNTANDVEKSAPFSTSGGLLPSFREIQFRILSTGGAVITGLRFKYEFNEDRSY